MPTIIPECTSCKNFFSKESITLCCNAFPNGIPSDFFWGKVNVRTLKECNNNYKFENSNEWQNTLEVLNQECFYYT